MKRPAVKIRLRGPVVPGRVPRSAPFPIAGIGASAGGLEAFSELLRHLPVKTGMAFVLVQHLDPKHSSELQDILSRTTKIPVVEATDRLAVQPDHIYVMPPNTSMTIRDGILRLSPRVLMRGRNLPIDHFLRSLAEDRGNRAISVILSGTASDGTEGSRAIKVAGGITFAQDEKSAKYASMPHSARIAGGVDFTLSPPPLPRNCSGWHSTRIWRRFPRTNLTSPSSRVARWQSCSRCCGKPPEWTSPTTSTPACTAASTAASSCISWKI